MNFILASIGCVGLLFFCGVNFYFAIEYFGEKKYIRAGIYSTLFAMMVYVFIKTIIGL